MNRPGLIDRLIAENDRLRASLQEMMWAAESGDFYLDYDEAWARIGRARKALGQAES